MNCEDGRREGIMRAESGGTITMHKVLPPGGFFLFQQPADEHVIEAMAALVGNNPAANRPPDRFYILPTRPFASS